GHTDEPTVYAIVGQAARDVRVMMLDGHAFDAVERVRISGRAICGMKVMSDDLGGQLKQPAKVADCFNVRAEGRLVCGAAQVLAEDGFVAADDRKGALDLAPTSQDRTCRRHGQPYGERDVAAR